MLFAIIIVRLVVGPVSIRHGGAVGQPHKGALRAVAVRVVRAADPGAPAAHKGLDDGVPLCANGNKEVVQVMYFLGRFLLCLFNFEKSS